MIFREETFDLNGKKILLRSPKATEEEAKMLMNYLETVSGETNFLLCYPDELKFTMESEFQFINGMNESEEKMLILAFVDGEYAGNCSFHKAGTGRRSAPPLWQEIFVFSKMRGFVVSYLIISEGSDL